MTEESTGEILAPEPTHPESLKLDLNAQEDNGNEVEDITSTPSSLKPPQETLDQENDILIQKYIGACQSGDILTVRDLIESGLVEIGEDVDSNGVSGLHWASINNRLSLVKYLLSKGVDVDREGGELSATALHWACRYGLVYIVDTLLKAGADPTKVDSQGFNALHLAVHSSNIMLVIYLLVFHDDLPIDSLDPSDRTPLHWAAYQGDSLSVDVLLKFGALVRKVDNQGFTPLHWALIRGQKECLKRLLEEGSDIYHQNNEGKSGFEIANDMNSTKNLYIALHEAGFKKDGSKIYKPFTDKWAKLVTYLTPFVLMGLVLKVFASLNLFIALPLNIAIIFVVSTILNKYVFPCYILSSSPLLKSPFLSGIFSASSFWVTIVWITTLFPATYSEIPFSNLSFITSIGIVLYAFQRTMFRNPGTIETNESETKSTISELIKDGNYDAKNFCIHTFIRKPLRSKYSYFYKRCVARFDHYCPWVYNDIGLRNHKSFIFFVVSGAFAMASFVHLAFEYFDEIDDDNLSCFILTEDLCAGFTHSRFIFLLTAWTIFQLIWVIFLLFSQLFQISKGVTTLELSNITQKSDLGANPYYSSAPTEFANSVPQNSSDTTGKHSHKNCFTTICLLTGLDQFRIALKQSLGVKDDSRLAEIPTNYGIKQNCIDFWFASGDDTLKVRNFFKLPVHGEASLNGQVVDYYKLVQFPEHRVVYDNPV